MALLLGGGRRPRGVLRPARHPVAQAAPRPARARPATVGGALPDRSRAGADRGAERLRRIVRPRLGGRAVRQHRPLPEPRADLDLRDLLARCPGADRSARIRLARSLSLAGNRRPLRLAAGARRQRGEAPGRLPRALRAVAGRGGAPRVHGDGARVLGPGEPARARVRDRALLLRRALRDGGVRPRDLAGERGGVRGHVPLPRADRAVPRAGRKDPAALALHRPRRGRTRPGLGGVRRRDARLGPVRRLQPHDDLAGSRGARREPVRHRSPDAR